MSSLSIRALALVVALSNVGAFATACGGPVVELTDRTVKVACGACVFHMPGAAGCYWAAEVDGTHYWVQGVEPQGPAEGHAPDGMCSMPRDAVVDGRLEGDRLVVTSWELLPAADVPASSGHAHHH